MSHEHESPPEPADDPRAWGAWVQEYEAKEQSMGLTVRNTDDSTYEDPPVGTYPAICVRLIDIGVQRDVFEGKEKIRHQVILGFELPDQLMSDGQPFLVHKFYTASLHEKSALRHDLQAWRGRAFTKEEEDGFDLHNVLGKGCMLSIVPKATKTGTRVGAIMGLPKSIKLGKPHNPAWAFDSDDHTQAEFEQLPKGFQEMVRSRIVPKPDAGTPGKTIDEDDVPF